MGVGFIFRKHFYGLLSWTRLNRQIHYWGALAVALPAVLIIVTGILLIVRSEFSWLQPEAMRGEVGAPRVTYAEILVIACGIPQAEVSGWEDISRINTYPRTGLIKIRAKNYWEIQIDQKSGDVLQVAFRNSNVIHNLHTGRFFHKWAELGVFLPAAIVLFVLWISGLYMFLFPLLRKRWMRLQAGPR